MISANRKCQVRINDAELLLDETLKLRQSSCSCKFGRPLSGGFGLCWQLVRCHSAECRIPRELVSPSGRNPRSTGRAEDPMLQPR